MNRCLLVVFCLMLSQAASASLITVSGNASGIWSADTIQVVGEVVVPVGQTLTIQPGVEVQFTGLYALLVQGRLNAVGTIEDSIIFTRALPNEDCKWRGLRLDSADDASLVEFCRIEWAKGIGTYPAVHGGAVWINNCSPTVRHCRLANNYSHNANYNGTGAGVCLDQNCSSLIEYNDIVMNQADSGGGICIGSGCDPVIRHNLIENNQGFYSGGGIYVSANARSTIYNNVIRNNTTDGYGGGGINLWSATWLYGTTSNVYNNLIVNNSASSAGGGIYSRYDGSQIHNNTIIGNQSPMGAGVYVLTFSDLPPTLTSNIIWDNVGTTGSQIYADPQTGSVVEVAYCDVQGGWPGIGNLNSDPLFAAGPGGFYYLSQIASGQNQTSPCVDAGDPGAPMFTGTTRTDGEQDIDVMDMGYHFDLSAGPPPSLDLTLAPIAPPIIIPAGGGTFNYNITVANNGANPITFQLWTKVQLPHGSWNGPLLGPLWLTLNSGQSLTRLRSQTIPAYAPTGSYTYRGWVGGYPLTPVDSSSFHFTKEGVENLPTAPGDWACTGNPFTAVEEATVTLPLTSFKLVKVSPNPFNLATRLSFNLATAGHVRLNVYDISGRMVAVLMDSWQEAGNHEVLFDGSPLSAGVYLYDLAVDLDHITGKMVFLK
jgi:parallel beta-helix repeat protein